MNSMLKPIATGICFVTLMCLADAPYAPYRIGFVPEASAFFVARRAVVGTAVVVGTVAVASASANANAAAHANAAAAANANAAAANANAAAAKAQAPAGLPPVGSITTMLPPGCVPDRLNGVDYERCGSTYYRATMSGSNLVFVVAQP